MSENKSSVKNTEVKKKITFKKIKKIFTTFIIPILTAIPKIINSIANYKRAIALAA